MIEVGKVNRLISAFVFFTFVLYSPILLHSLLDERAYVYETWQATNFGHVEKLVSSCTLNLIPGGILLGYKSIKLNAFMVKKVGSLTSADLY